MYKNIIVCQHYMALNFDGFQFYRKLLFLRLLTFVSYYKQIWTFFFQMSWFIEILASHITEIIPYLGCVFKYCFPGLLFLFIFLILNFAKQETFYLYILESVTLLGLCFMSYWKAFPIWSYKKILPCLFLSTSKIYLFTFKPLFHLECIQYF